MVNSKTMRLLPIIQAKRNVVSIECSAMAQAATVAPDATLADNATASERIIHLPHTRFTQTVLPIITVLAHWDVLASVDFTTIEVRAKSGLVTVYLLFVMELATRRVYFSGSTTNPDEPWMLQIARNMSDAEEGFLREKTLVDGSRHEILR